MRESFVIHAEYIEDLPEEFKPVFLTYIYQYGIHGTIPELAGLELSIWKKIQRRIDQDVDSWEEQKNKRSEAGKKHKGNQYTRKENPEQQKMEQMEHCSNCSNEMEHTGTNGTVSVFDSVSVSVFDSVSVPPSQSDDPVKTAKFKKPTLEEVREYIAEKNYSFSADKFWNYYESNGWKVGKNPMKNWKAACTTWNQNNFSPHNDRIAIDSNVKEFKQFFQGG